MSSPETGRPLPLTRRRILSLAGGLLLTPPLSGLLDTHGAGAATAESAGFVPPTSPRATLNMNPGWRFVRQDVAGAEAPGFDDSAWIEISTPHTYNDTDTFDEIITRSGEHDEYMGVAWYRKRFKIPTAYATGKVFLEFEGMKQAGRVFLNGKPLALFENGISPCGIDLTDAVRFGEEENLLAVRVDNSRTYVEEATGTAFEWMSRDFDPNYGGINRNVRLHLTGKVYQTLPLYQNLQTTGVYIYAKQISPSERTAEIRVESQVRNESGAPQTVALSIVVADAGGRARLTLTGETATLAPGETRVLTASGLMTAVNLWEPRTPSLYDVYSQLTIDGKTVDVCRTRTGFRKTAFRGGAGQGGIYINDRFVFLKGYAQRSTNEWAGLGQAYPDWMHDYHAGLVRGSNANYIRWMHITPQLSDVIACDTYGIVEICPAGDKERDGEGRQWEQRLEAMRNAMIYLRNHPSILFWEAGNNGVSAAHLQQMQDLHKQWDPNGGRALGCRSISDAASVPIAEYYGTMVTEDPRLHAPRAYAEAFRGYSDERRDRGPLVECEDFRDEAARRFWDDYSPPHFGFKKKSDDTYALNSETFCLGAVRRYNEYYSERISNPDPKCSKWSAYASIIFADSNSHGRQYGSEVCRVSGKVDAVRLPKQIYFTHRVLQNEQPDIHLIGHWSYPAGTTKTIYVVSNCPAVTLLLNGKPIGTVKQPADGYLFAFPNVVWRPGTLRAIGLQNGKPICEHALTTAGPPKRLRLTARTGPRGLQADGADIALIDVEVVDARGRRCPTDEARVDFAITGPAIWRGGYNSGIPGSTNNRYLLTECGINRVAVRAMHTPGTITVRATRPGLEPATIIIAAQPFMVTNGLSAEMPPRIPLSREGKV